MKKGIKTILLGSLVGLFAIGTLTGCHTVEGTAQGMKQDIQTITPPPKTHHTCTNCKYKKKYRHKRVRHQTTTEQTGMTSGENTTTQSTTTTTTTNTQ